MNKIGGIGCIVTGSIFFIRELLDFVAGPIPTDGKQILHWMETEKIFIAFVSEALFFATISLIPAIIALYNNLINYDKVKVLLGCGVMASIIPVLSILLIIHGRLVYPVFGLIVKTPELAELVMALFYGGLHAVGLLMAISTFLLSLAMHNANFGRVSVYSGILSGIADIAWAYPYLIGSSLSLICMGVFAFWFVSIGLKLIFSTGVKENI